MTCEGKCRRKCDPCRKRRGREYMAKYRARFPEREKAKRAKWRAENRAKYLEQLRASAHRRRLRHKYGITQERYDAILAAQGGACAICARHLTTGRVDGPCVDHCHSTGKVRGILCGRCNTAVGLFGDTPERMLAAIAYLKRAEVTITELASLPKERAS